MKSINKKTRHPTQTFPRIKSEEGNRWGESCTQFAVESIHCDWYQLGLCYDLVSKGNVYLPIKQKLPYIGHQDDYWHEHFNGSQSVESHITQNCLQRKGKKLGRKRAIVFPPSYGPSYRKLHFWSIWIENCISRTTQCIKTRLAPLCW